MMNSHLVGNDFLKKRLFSKDIKHSTQPVLIYGEKGLGKFLTAKLYAARYIMGEDKYMASDDFLLEKDTKLVLDEKHPDLFIIDARGSAVKIVEVREMISHTHIKPNQAENNVIIIRDCDELTIQAQNTLLKVLEDPPENTVLILTASSSYALLETIRSRVRIMPIEPVKDEEAYKYISEHMQSSTDEEISEAIKYFPGNIGKMISFLEEEDKEDENEYFLILKNIVDSITRKDMYSLLVALDEIKKDRQTFIRVSKELENLYRDALLPNDENKNKLALSIYDSLDLKEIYRGLRCLEEILKQSIWNPNLSVNSLKLAWGLIYIENEE